MHFPARLANPIRLRYLWHIDPVKYQAGLNAIFFVPYKRRTPNFHIPETRT